MDDLANLQYLSLVSKICTELDNHLGISDKTLAEFIIDLAKAHPELPAFRKALEENGAEFPEPFSASLLTLVAKMTPKKPAATASSSQAGPSTAAPTEKFHGLAVPNDSAERLAALEREALGGNAVADPSAPRRGGKEAAMPPPPARPAAERPESRPPDDAPIPGRVYAGKVSNVMDFGCFVQLENVRGRAEGLVHVSLIGGPQGARAHDLAKRGQRCYVKVL